MERLVVNYARGRFKGKSIATWKKEIAKEMGVDYIDYELDHIIPFCISADNNRKNLQLLKSNEHKNKSGKDRKILKQLRERGFYEKITHYSLELLKPQKEVIEEFIRLDRLDGLDG